MKKLLTILLVMFCLETMGQKQIVIQPMQFTPAQMEERIKTAEKVKKAAKQLAEKEAKQAERERIQAERERIQAERDKNHDAHAGSTLTQIKLTLWEIPGVIGSNEVFKDRRIEVLSNKGIVLQVKLEDKGVSKYVGTNYHSELYTFIPQQITTYGDLLKELKWSIKFTQREQYHFSSKVLWTLNFSDGNIVKLTELEHYPGTWGPKWSEAKIILTDHMRNFSAEKWYKRSEFNNEFDFATQAEICRPYVPKD